MKNTLMLIVLAGTFAGTALAQKNYFSLVGVYPASQPFYQKLTNLVGPHYYATAPEVWGACRSLIWDDSTHHYTINNFQILPRSDTFDIGNPWACSPPGVTAVRQSWGSTSAAGAVFHQNPDTGDIVWGVERYIDAYWSFMGMNYDEWDDEQIFCDDYTNQVSRFVYPTPQPC